MSTLSAFAMNGRARGASTGLQRLILNLAPSEQKWNMHDPGNNLSSRMPPHVLPLDDPRGADTARSQKSGAAPPSLPHVRHLQFDVSLFDQVPETWSSFHSGGLWIGFFPGTGTGSGSWQGPI